MVKVYFNAVHAALLHLCSAVASSQTLAPWSHTAMGVVHFSVSKPVVARVDGVWWNSGRGKGPWLVV